MDAFVVLDREEYIAFTKHTPPVKEEYIPKDKYKMTSQDFGIV
jgi:hypothetical protein